MRGRKDNLNFILCLEQKKAHISFKCLVVFLIGAFLLSSLIPFINRNPPQSYASTLPDPGQLLEPTPSFVPAMVRGLRINPNDPFEFNFIIDTGDKKDLSKKELRKASEKLIRYFLASLTVPEKDLWVNLSPYEENRIIPAGLGQTDLGRDLLGQDYILKQLLSSLTYPESPLGKKFWDKVYQQAYQKYGTTNIPINTFNKIWIVPAEAQVYENGDTAYVTKAKLKVMLEEDYFALGKNLDNKKIGTDELDEADTKNLSSISSKVTKEIILPAIEKEINEGKNFASLRQVYSALILATWFKQKLKQSILSDIYVDKNKIKGIDLEDKEVKNKIYARYVKAYKKGVYDFIKTEYDPHLKRQIRRQYYSGGFDGTTLDKVVNAVKVAKDKIAELARGKINVMTNLKGLTVATAAKAKAAQAAVKSKLSRKGSGIEEGTGIGPGTSGVGEGGSQNIPSIEEWNRKVLRQKAEFVLGRKVNLGERLLIWVAHLVGSGHLGPRHSDGTYRFREGTISARTIRIKQAILRFLGLGFNKQEISALTTYGVVGTKQQTGFGQGVFGVGEDANTTLKKENRNAKKLAETIKSSDTTYQQKVEAISALGETVSRGSQPAADALAGIIRSDVETSLKEAAIDALGRIANQGSQPAAEALAGIIKSDIETDLKIAAIFALRKAADQGSQPAIEAIEELILVLEAIIKSNTEISLKIEVIFVLRDATFRGSQPAVEALAGIMKSDIETSLKEAAIDALRDDANLDSQPVVEAIEKLIPDLEAIIKSNTETSLKEAAIYALRDAANRGSQPVVEAIEKLIPDLEAIIKSNTETSLKEAAISALGDVSRGSQPAAEALAAIMKSDIETSLKKLAISALLGDTSRGSQLAAEALVKILDYKSDINKLIDFLTRKSYGIKAAANFLESFGSDNYFDFFKELLRKRDTSGLDIILGIRLENLSRNNEFKEVVSKILSLAKEKNYETLRDILIDTTTAFSVIKNASLPAEGFLGETKSILGQYAQGEIGRKQIKKETAGLRDRYLKQALGKLSQKISDTDIEKLLTDKNIFSYLINLIGVYFKTKDNYPDTGEKIKQAVEKLVELKDASELNRWLYQQSELNSSVYQKLIKAGYNPLLWEQGLTKVVPVEEGIENKKEEIAKQTSQLSEDIATKYNIEVPDQYKKLETAAKAREFADNYLLNNESISQAEKANIKAILAETEKLEKKYSQETEAGKVRVEVSFDFLKDTYAGVGVPGCFNPHTGQYKNMPLMHSLEADSLFLRVYQQGKQVANAVLVLTAQGVVVYPLYNASGYNLNAAVFDILADLVKRGWVPKILFNQNSAGFTAAESYAQDENKTSSKEKILSDNYYLDFGSVGSITTTYSVGKDNLADYQPAEELKEESSQVQQERQKRDEKEAERKTEARKQLFSLDLKHLNLGSVLGQIHDILFNPDFSQAQIRQIVDNLKTKNKENISKADAGLIYSTLISLREQEGESGKGLKIEVVDSSSVGDDLINLILDLQNDEYIQPQLFSESELREAFENPDSVNLIVKDESGNIIGYIIGRPFQDAEEGQLLTGYLPNEINKQEAYYVDDLLIHSQQRNSKVLIKLLTNFRTQARKKGIKAIFMHARVNNGLSQHLEKMGAERIERFGPGEWDPDLDEPFDLLKMNIAADAESGEIIKNNNMSNQSAGGNLPSPGQEQAPGGIDLTPAQMNIDVQGQGVSPAQFQVPFDTQTFQGFTFNIIKIETIDNLGQIFGKADQEPSNQLSQL